MDYLYVLLCLLGIVMPPQKATPGQWAALKRIALVTEIAGPHESWGEFPNEINYCRRFAQLLHDAPPLADAGRLPGGAQESIWLADRFCCYLEDRPQVQSDAVRRALKRTCWCRLVWQQIYAAKEPSAAWSSRRNALKELRQMVGPAAYYTGQWPTAIPMEYLREVE